MPARHEPNSSPGERTPRVVIADDHPLMRAALREAVIAAFESGIVDEASSVADLLLLLTNSPSVDVVLLDLKMPDAKGFSALVNVRASFPDVPVVIVSATEDVDSVDRAILLGASGYVLKSSPIDDVRSSVLAVLAGEIARPERRSSSTQMREEDVAQLRRVRGLTPQQLNVLIMVAEGHSNKAIAELLRISESTVKSHVTTILLKLGLQSRTQAALFAQRTLHLQESVAQADEDGAI